MKRAKPLKITPTGGFKGEKIILCSYDSGIGGNYRACGLQYADEFGVIERDRRIRNGRGIYGQTFGEQYVGKRARHFRKR